MKKSKFSEEQIIKILAEGKSGKSVEEICREHKISNFTFYTWRKKFSVTVDPKIEAFPI